MNHYLIIAARVISVVFTPFYLPLVALAALFGFSYLSLLPFSYKATVIGMVYLFTVLAPTLLIHAYRRLNGWTSRELGSKEGRTVPYIISIACYFVCIYMMEQMRIPQFMCAILRAAILIQVVCAVLNAWWKISTHTAAIGGVAGALVSFAAIFGFNPVRWLCVVFILGGMLGTSRMILRQHTLSQVVGGFCVGAACAAAGVLFV